MQIAGGNVLWYCARTQSAWGAQEHRHLQAGEDGVSEEMGILEWQNAFLLHTHYSLLQVAAQLKPVWESLKKKNEPYKLKQISCHVSLISRLFILFSSFFLDIHG